MAEAHVHEWQPGQLGRCTLCGALRCRRWRCESAREGEAQTCAKHDRGVRGRRVLVTTYARPAAKPDAPR